MPYTLGGCCQHHQSYEEDAHPHHAKRGIHFFFVTTLFRLLVVNRLFLALFRFLVVLYSFGQSWGGGIAFDLSQNILSNSCVFQFAVPSNRRTTIRARLANNLFSGRLFTYGFPGGPLESIQKVVLTVPVRTLHLALLDCGPCFP
jgi:hypothetical protein